MTVIVNVPIQFKIAVYKFLQVTAQVVQGE
jgi:hypothetical protein